MIDWLIQSTGDHPDLARGVAPAGLLNPNEQIRLASLKTEKRRRDWLLGRWTAKRLIQSHVEQRTGVRPPLDALVVENDPDGAPHAILDFRFWILDSDANLQSTIHNLKSLSLSISHCDDHAFCALSDREIVRVGADIERIEPRARQFAEDYFTAAELDHVRAAPQSDLDTIVTLIWSAKEAALKALRLGLTVDTRSVAVGLEPISRFGASWTPLAVSGAPDLLAGPAGGRRQSQPIAGSAARAQPNMFSEPDIAPPGGAAGAGRQLIMNGWWRVMDAYVLTLVVLRSEQRRSAGLAGMRYPN